MSQSSSAIALHTVRKAFRTVVAVDDVSFEVNRGEIFGLLGPNGAGKTTLLRLIMDIFRPDSGSIEVFGRGFQKEDKAHIGYLPEERGLYTRQKVQAVLEYFVQLKGVPQRQARIKTLHWLWPGLTRPESGCGSGSFATSTFSASSICFLVR